MNPESNLGPYRRFAHRFQFELTSGHVEVLQGDTIAITDKFYSVKAANGGILHQFPAADVRHWSKLPDDPAPDTPM